MVNYGRNHIKPDGSFLLPISQWYFKIEISFLGQNCETENVNVKKNTLLDLGVITLQTTQNFLNEVVANTHRSAVQNKIDRQVYLASEFSIAKVVQNGYHKKLALDNRH